ncbi:MAG: SsrA-binding protein SmpB [Proteobacteria bacterium]|nr:SsrA-binding protein SmpB [Pseudomonadota bacterium]
MAKSKKSDFISTGLVAQNRRAHFDYLISEKFVAGLELTGTEVKSLRLGHANITDAFGVIKGEELFMSNMFIAEYANKGYASHPEKRERKLLLKKKEIIDIINSLSRKGTTLVAIRLFFDNHGRAKLEIGLGTGKKNYDKREAVKDRDWKIQKARLMAN